MFTTARTSDQPMLRALTRPGTIRFEIFRAKDLAAECHRRTCLWARDLFAYQDGLVIFGISMCSASVSLEFDKIAAQERDRFSKASDAYARDGSLPHECVFTELSRRMSIMRNVSQCTHVYNWWKTVAALVETWSDHDMWEAAVKKELSDLALLASKTTGGTCNGMFMLQHIGATDYMVCMVPFHSQQGAVVHSTMRTCVFGVCARGEASRWSVAKGLSARATML